MKERARHCGILGVIMATLLAGAVYAQELGCWSFADGGRGWTPIQNATVSEIARRPGGKSLVIRQNNDQEADSAWLSPILKNPGKPIQVSVWAADNYDTQKDLSYAAAFEIVPCDREGKLTTNGGDWTWVPWEDKRQIPQFRHTMTAEGLQWEFYSAVKRTNGDYFRVRLCWPKAMSRGECYFTDVRVAVAEEAAVTAKAATPVAVPGRFALEMSTPANANLFFADDPLRFDFLLYTTDGKPVGTLQAPVVQYKITDYEYFHVASGAIPFTEAKPLVHKMLARDKKRDRTQNLYLSTVLTEAAAKGVGREFFIHAKLLDGDKVLAEDTVTYAVVNPRVTDPKDYDKCRFISFAEGGGLRNGESAHERQTIVDKMGTSMVHDWDYSGWLRAQPVKDGPITITPGPAFPKLVYCPNLEQIRGRKPDHPWGDMSKNAPAWALNDDPFHPGCKGFEIDGYVQYILAYVRANRHRIVQVVPSGLERFIDARTLELQRKAYAAIKKEFPDLPVGMMVWGINNSEEMVDLVLKEKLYEVSDFFNTHVYLSSVNWSASERLARELKKLGIERRMISTEFARVGGNDQLQSSRDLIAAMLDAHAHGMDRVTYFLMYVANRRDPVLRGEFPGDGFQWMQYVDRPRFSEQIKDNDWGRGLYGVNKRGDSLMPLLKTTVYYNFVQAVECAEFKTVFQPNEQTIAYVYARDGKTICYLFQREPGTPVTLSLTTGVPYIMQDLYGRTDRITPKDVSLVVATQDPLALLFEGEVPELYAPKSAVAALRPASGGLALPVIARGTTGTAVLTLPAGARAFTARITASVDGTWPQVAPAQFPVAVGQAHQLRLPISIAESQSAGSYTFTTRIYDGDTLISVLKQPLHVGELLTAQLSGSPKIARQDPAVIVTLHSLADTPMSGTVRVANRFFGAGFEPAMMEQPYTIAPKGTAEIRFPIPRDQANLATSYEMRATLTDQSGFSLTCEDDVSFQASVKTKTPITVDGNLADWKLDELIPIPFEKWFKGPCEPQQFSGHFYSRWDDEKLYFAMEITDSTPVVTGTDQVGWNDDNIMVCLYPWEWHMGAPLNAGYYREHIGPLKDGKAGISRVGNVPSGPMTAEGTAIAVTRTATGWVYEWAYPKVSLSPLTLERGGAFRLSVSVWDQRKADKQNTQDWGEFSWLTFSGFNSSVNALPNLWRQFRLVEE